MYFIYNFISNLHSYDTSASDTLILLHKYASLAMEGPSQPTQVTPPTPHTKAQSLEEILYQLGPFTNVSYNPFQPEQPSQPAKALLPPSFPQKPCPFDYFTLFFTHDLFQTITTNTNRYAGAQKIHTKQERAREWTDLLLEELYMFIGAIIYMGVRNEPRVDMYWNTDFNKGGP
jgi:hypothetical protein